MAGIAVRVGNVVEVKGTNVAVDSTVIIGPAHEIRKMVVTKKNYEFPHWISSHAGDDWRLMYISLGISISLIEEIATCIQL